jgi:hypothetical protein
MPNSFPKYVCDFCNFSSKKHSNYLVHLQTKKHIKHTTNTKNEVYICNCYKEFKTKSGLWKHKKKCQEQTIQSSKYDKKFSVIKEKHSQEQLEQHDEIAGVSPALPHLKGAESLDYKELILQVLNQNKELQELLIKQQEEHDKKYENLLLHIQPNNNTIIKNSNNKTITNNQNNHYNIMMFLNDKCKDAMTIQEFADRLVVSIDDLEKKKIDCLTNTILKNLKSLKITERPVHCGNAKRKEWYLNHKDTGWELDNGEKLIKTTEFGINKKFKKEFVSHYPNYETHDQLQDKYTGLLYRIFTDLPEHEQSKLLNVVAKDLMIDIV